MQVETRGYFLSVGYENQEKVERFFTNAKLSLAQKERCWVMVLGDQIAWIVGLRIDDRFEITGKTNMVVRVTKEYPDNLQCYSNSIS